MHAHAYIAGGASTNAQLTRRHLKRFVLFSSTVFFCARNLENNSSSGIEVCDVSRNAKSIMSLLILPFWEKFVSRCTYTYRACRCVTVTFAGREKKDVVGKSANYVRQWVCMALSVLSVFLSTPDKNTLPALLFAVYEKVLLCDAYFSHCVQLFTCSRFYDAFLTVARCVQLLQW